MTKSPLLFFFGYVLGVFGVPTTSVHILNIERAIAGLEANIASNSVSENHYDFVAVLEEIKAVQPEQQRMKLLSQCVDTLFLIKTNQWIEVSGWDSVAMRRHLLEAALHIADGDRNILFRWSCRIKMLKSIKKELSFYDDERTMTTNCTAKIKVINCEFTTEDLYRVKTSLRNKSEAESRERNRRLYSEHLKYEIRNYEKYFFDRDMLQNDCARMSRIDQCNLMAMVREELGRYPKWYQPDDVNSKPKSKMLEDEIRSFAGMLSGTGQLVRTWVTGTNLLARIVNEPDEQDYMRHFKEMESAILGMKFREGAFADSYNEWDHSIVMFGKLSSWYSVALWKKRKDSPWLWEFYLKLLNVYRKEIERIANAKEKPLPPRFNGIYGTLEATQSRLKFDRNLTLQKFSSYNFISNYIALPPAERVAWLRRIEKASGLEFKFEVHFKEIAEQLRVIGAPVKEK